jgi:hypothetical protein
MSEDDILSNPGGLTANLDAPVSLSPIKDTLIPGHWIIYAKQTLSGQFTVFVDKKYFRLFSLENMPDELKEKLVLIHSVENNVLDDEGMPPKFLEDVGWRLVKKRWYQFVVSEKLLSELRGMPLVSGMKQTAGR